MHKNVHQRSRGTTDARFTLKMTSAAVSLAVLSMSGVAFAQAKPEEPKRLETVEVSGIRKGIEDAISVKKDADSIVEAISAEDIGKLPDTTIAESISRLPGVTAQRDKSTGKASSISVRGMSPDFNGGLLNGREQASTGDSRGVQLDQYPAELIGQVLVYKTPEATLIGQGLSSTIDNRMVRPLDFAKRTVAAGYRTVKTAIAAGPGTNEGKGDRFSLSYIDQFADRKFGIALGFTRLDEKGGDQLKFNSWGGWSPERTFEGQTVRTIGGFGSDTETLSQKRDGAIAVLQFKPNKNFETTLDILHSKGSTALKKTGIEGAIQGNAGPYDRDGNIVAGVNTGGVLSSATFDNFKGVVRNHVEATDDELKSWGLNAKLRFGDWLAVGDIAQSKVTRVGVRIETTAGQPGNAATLDTISYTGWTGSNNDAVSYKPGLNYGDRNAVRLTDVMGWSGGTSSPQAGYLAQPVVTDKIDSVRMSLSRALSAGHLTRVDFGLNVADRAKTRSTEEGRLVIKGGDPYGVAAVPGSSVVNAGVSGIPVVSFDPRGTVGSIYELAAKVDSDIFNKSWTVDEKTTTAYFRFDLDGNLGKFAYRANIGAQIVNTDQSSSGNNISLATCTGNTPATCPVTTITGGKKYTDFLPSLNATFDMGGDSVVRLGLGQALSRANMGDMRASKSFSYDNTKQIYSGSGGNPELEPFRAKALDLSYEKYFGKKGYVSVAGFYKSLDSYILQLGNLYDFKPLLGNSIVPPGASTTGIMTTPVNGNGGTIKGIELAVNVPFALFAKPLDGFGLIVNHSDTNSSINLESVGISTADVGLPKVPLPGLSKRVTNARLYFEKFGFQIAAAMRQRSDFLGEISDYQDNKKYTFVKAETTYDLQVGYEFGSGPMKGLSFTLQGSNLSNAKFQRFNPIDGAIVETIKYGKTYTAGLNYKF